MHALSIVKDFKFADCGQITGYSELMGSNWRSTRAQPTSTRLRPSALAR